MFSPYFILLLHAINETIKREKLPEQIENLYRGFLNLRDKINNYIGEFETLGKHIKNVFNKYHETEKIIKRLRGDSNSLVLEDDYFIK